MNENSYMEDLDATMRSWLEKHGMLNEFTEEITDLMAMAAWSVFAAQSVFAIRIAMHMDNAEEKKG